MLECDSGVLCNPFAVPLPKLFALVDGWLDLHAEVDLSCVIEEDG